jgi:hypothetical protein
MDFSGNQPLQSARSIKTPSNSALGDAINVTKEFRMFRLRKMNSMELSRTIRFVSAHAVRLFAMISIPRRFMALYCFLALTLNMEMRSTWVRDDTIRMEKILDGNKNHITNN